MKASAYLIPVWLLAAAHGHAQDPGTDFQRLTDELAHIADGETGAADLENLILTLSEPFELNNVSAGELRMLKVLSEQQIVNLLAYRDGQERILHVLELQVIPGFDAATIARLLPFVTVADPQAVVGRPLLRRMFAPGHSYLVVRSGMTLEKKRGADSAFAGSPENLYLRFRAARSGDFSAGITAEKDAGEKLHWPPSRGQPVFDFTSVHLQLQNKGRLKNFIAGDFQMQFGQGLLLGGAFGLGKGGEAVANVRRGGAGFLPYTSVNENAFMRGAAITYQLSGALQVSGFHSQVSRDGSAGKDSVVAATTLSSSGLHRTARELEGRRRVGEQNSGLVIGISRGRVDAGAVANLVAYDIPLHPARTLYNQHAFRGTQNLNTGMFFNVRAGNATFFGEGGHSLGGGTGCVAGMLVSVHRKLDIAVAYRSYDAGFHTFFSNALSESSRPQNERGTYWGWHYRRSRRHSFHGYIDLFTFPWLSFRRYAPSRGYEWLLKITYQPSRNALMFAQFREERKERNLQTSSTTYQLAMGIRRNFTAHAEYSASRHLRLKTRVQYNRYHFQDQRTDGLALLQDITVSAGRWQFSARHALFDAGNHDNRLYIYEQDAWLSYSMPSYSGVGVRNYAILEYKVHARLTLWLRYARTRFLHREEIGSGHDVIEGNTRNDVKFQARFNF